MVNERLVSSLKAKVTNTEIIKTKSKEMVVLDLDISYLSLMHFFSIADKFKYRGPKRKIKKKGLPTNKTRRLVTTLYPQSRPSIEINVVLGFSNPLDAPAAITLEHDNQKSISIGTLVEFQVFEKEIS